MLSCPVKRGRSFTNWWGLVTRSHDGGSTWGPSQLLGALGGTPQSLQGGAPDKYMVGPAKNKCLLLDGGLILAGASREVTKKPQAVSSSCEPISACSDDREVVHSIVARYPSLRALSCLSTLTCCSFPNEWLRALKGFGLTRTFEARLTAVASGAC